MTETDPARVVLDGAIGIRTIVALRGDLLAALADQSAVTIDCAAVESVDLSFIQLLLSARLSARGSDKQLLLASPAGGALREALEKGGFLGQPATEPFWAGDA